MLSFNLPLLLLLAVPATVLACEGECIVSITNAWRGNYTARLDSVFHNLVRIFYLFPLARPPTRPPTS